ncbi:hypothetical protein BSMD_023030 [Bacillus subtilis Miyagi-4]|nr:hypothetical protein BSMD_023030 [Bacillus subtilis Miyagi-4]
MIVSFLPVLKGFCSFCSKPSDMLMARLCKNVFPYPMN